MGDVIVHYSDPALKCRSTGAPVILSCCDLLLTEAEAGIVSSDPDACTCSGRLHFGTLDLDQVRDSRLSDRNRFDLFAEVWHGTTFAATEGIVDPSTARCEPMATWYGTPREFPPENAKRIRNGRSRSYEIGRRIGRVAGRAWARFRHYR